MLHSASEEAAPEILDFVRVSNNDERAGLLYSTGPEPLSNPRHLWQSTFEFVPLQVFLVSLLFLG
jgi:hypothetical protein